MRNEFIRTENVINFEELCRELSGPDSRIGPSLGMITGRAGRGKSEAAKKAAVQQDAIYIPPMLIRTPFGLLKDICFELAALRPGRSDGCLSLIQAEMQKHRRLIIVDEADLLGMKVLEMLRNLNEMTGAPIMLIGEDELVAKIESRRRLSSRIRRKMAFGPVSHADVAYFYKKSLDQDLESDVVQILHNQCRGDWRPVLTTALAIERALNASNLDTVTADLAKNVIQAQG